MPADTQPAAAISHARRTSWSDSLRFAVSMVADPGRVASVVPSSRLLARLITSEISADDAPIIELGPGTGVFTHQLLDRGIAEEDLALVELGSEFARMLRKRFPAATVLERNATELGQIEVFGSRKAGTVISGLPIKMMKRSIVDAILAGVFANLREGGRFYQFTYYRRPPVPEALIEKHGLKVTKIGSTWRNIPPARVYRFERA